MTDLYQQIGMQAKYMWVMLQLDSILCRSVYHVPVTISVNGIEYRVPTKYDE